jgi:hypothetical protein
LLTPEQIQLRGITISKPTELYLLKIPSEKQVKAYKLELLFKMKEWHELKSNVCYYQ